jgi:hypothetical protein
MTMRPRGKHSVNGESTSSSAIGDDTIELQLTSEQLQELSQAAEEAQRDAAAFSFPEPLPEPSPAPASSGRRWHHISIAKMAAATIAYAAFAWWGAAQLAGQPQPQAVAATRPPVVVPQPAVIASSPQPAVHVINPFDASEVFEFPAGTSRAESREKVAQILLERARERQSQWERIKPAPVSVRTASLYRSP